LFDFKEWHPRLAKKREDLFLEVTPKKGLDDLCGRKFVGKIAQKNFSVKFEEIRAKILRTPKNLPVPTPVMKRYLHLHCPL